MVQVDVERALGSREGHVGYGGQGFHHGLAPDVELLAHFLNAILRAGHGFHGAPLGEAVDGEHEALLQQGHAADDFGGSGKVADAPTGHGIGLGEGAEDDGTVAHTRFGRDGTVFEAVIQQAVIGFVGNHQQVVGLGEIGDLAELFLGKNRAGGVVRAVDEQHLGAFARFRAAPAEIGGLERISSPDAGDPHHRGFAS